jgi:hypothetical protein
MSKGRSAHPGHLMQCRGEGHIGIDLLPYAEIRFINFTSSIYTLFPYAVDHFDGVAVR